jgi:DNA-binding MarR family transcriptional regulator
MEQQDKKKRAVDFAIKATWLAISKMYNMLGQDYGVTHSTGFVLLNIDKENGTPATKIAPEIGMEARSLTRMLKVLEEEGLIYREADADDKRKVIIKLSDTGRIKREMSRQTVKVFHEKVHEQIAPEKLETFFEVVEKLQVIISEAEHTLLDTVKARLADMGITEDNEFIKKGRNNSEEGLF